MFVHGSVSIHFFQRAARLLTDAFEMLPGPILMVPSMRKGRVLQHSRKPPGEGQQSPASCEHAGVAEHAAGSPFEVGVYRADSATVRTLWTKLKAPSMWFVRLAPRSLKMLFGQLSVVYAANCDQSGLPLSWMSRKLWVRWLNVAYGMTVPMNRVAPPSSRLIASGRYTSSTYERSMSTIGMPAGLLRSGNPLPVEGLIESIVYSTSWAGASSGY